MNMENRDGVIWLDGELVPWREAKTHVLTHTLHYGMGVFEGIRAYKTRAGTALFRESGMGLLIALCAGLYPVLSHLKARYDGSEL